MITKKYVLGGALLASLSVFAQQEEPQKLEEVVVTDSRFELKRENSGKVVTSITREELEKQQGKSVAEILSTVSGISINGAQSNAGQNISIFARGGNNRQVLVLIDGVQLNDPSNIASDYDLRLLDVNTIERIEIIKGAASTLYGSGAATAVINIITRKASRDKIAFEATSVAGTNESQNNRDFSFNDFQNRVSVNGTLDKFTYLVGFSNQYTDGLSAVIDADSNESDPFSRYSTQVKFGYDFGDRFSLTAYGNYDKMDVDYDNSFPLEDAPFRSFSKQYRGGINSEYAYNKGSITLNAAYNSIEREFESTFPSAYDSDSYILGIFNRYTFSEKFYTVLGLNHINSRTYFGDQKSAQITDPYANVVYVSDFGLNVNAGARLNNHSEYGSQLTYSLNPSFAFEQENGYFKLFGSYATSYIAPSLSQLYGAFGANQELQPEEDRTLEGGAEWKLGSFRLSGTYFNRLEENFIDYVTIDQVTFEGEYQNIEDEFTVQGAEFELEGKLFKLLDLRANYTFTETKDRELLRLPKHTAFGQLGLNLNSGTFFSASYQYRGGRSDSDFSTGEQVLLDSYGLVDLYLSQKILKNQVNLFVGLNNVFNTDYVELVGYTTRGRNIRFGLNLSL